MIEPFAHPAWPEAHEKLAADVASGIARLARALRPRAKTEDHPHGDGHEASAEGETVHSTLSHGKVAIAAEPATSAAARYCLGEYYRELGERFDGGFDPELSLFPSLDGFSARRAIFLIVRLDGKPVGCGGLKPISADAAYLKRMWIAPAARGLGLARRLLSALEERAKALGYSVVRLETNKTLFEAQQLYRSSGYCEVPPFNDEPYAHHWFEKRLHARNFNSEDRRARQGRRGVAWTRPRS